MYSTMGYTCRACGLKITNGLRLMVDGAGDYHERCFRCYKCSNILAHCPYYEKNGSFYCRTDFMKTWAPQCKACGLPIEGQGVKIDGEATYHRSCFKCSRCYKVIDSQDGFTMSGGNRLCRDCAVHGCPAGLGRQSPSSLTRELNFPISPLSSSSSSPKGQSAHVILGSSSTTASQISTTESQRVETDFDPPKTRDRRLRDRKMMKRIRKAPGRIFRAIFVMTFHFLL